MGSNNLILIIVLIIVYIFAVLDNYKCEKKIIIPKHLTGNFRHKKTPKGVVTEVEVKEKGKLFYRPATKEELQFLKLTKYIE